MLHDISHPHTAAHTSETLWKLKLDVMAHPPYSLTISDCILFVTFKEALRACLFTSDQEVKEALYALLTADPKSFFSEGIMKLCNDGSNALKARELFLKIMLM
jgi:hypothetical protein